jgi:hypothetical protein
MRVLDHRQTTDARTDVHADTLGILCGDFQPGILECFDTRHQAEMDEAIHAAGILGGKMLGDIEIFYFAGNLSGHRRRIKMSDVGNARLARDDILPGRGYPDPDRGDDPQPGNHNSAFRQISSAKQKRPNRKRWASRK